MDNIIEVMIDNVLTPVDAEEWGTDPHAVTELVRENRLALRLDDHDTKAAAEALLGQAIS